jgi:hypothetical protein
VVTPVRKAGTLDRGAVKRDWQAVLLEIKKIKPARVQTFANVEVDVDPDGETLVVEFPSDHEFSLQLAEEPDNRDLLKRALTAVFGSSPPFRYQKGRGAVRPPDGGDAAPARSAVHVDVAPETAEEFSADPVAGQFETASGMAEPTAEEHGGAPASELEHLLVHGLGATIVTSDIDETEGEDS